MNDQPMPRILGRNEILEVDDVDITECAVPEWGGVVRVRTMSGRERDEFESRVIEFRGGASSVTTHKANIRALAVSMCVVNEEGNRMFSSQDVKRLGEKSCVPLTRIFEHIQKQSALTDDDLKELEGNSPKPGADGSG